MITIRCSSCKGIKGYTLGDMKTDCPACLGTGTELHDSPQAAVAAETVAVEVAATERKRAGRKPKLVTTTMPEVQHEHIEEAETA